MPQHHPNQPDDQAPKRLINDLRSLERDDLTVPPHVDDAIAETTRRHVEQMRDGWPAALVEDLRGLHSEAPAVSANVDARMAEATREHAAAIAHDTQRPLRFPALGWLASGVAAGIALLVGFMVIHEDRDAGWPGVVLQTQQPRDFDGNGHVNILDAMHLQRYIEAARRQRPSQDVDARVTRAADLTGDGLVDANDVETLAYDIVDLPGGAG